MGRAVAESIIEALMLKPAKPRKKLALGNPRLLAMAMTEAAAYYAVRRSEIPAPRKRLPRRERIAA
jgi:hypothetical protein